MSRINKSTISEERKHYKCYDFWLEGAKKAGYSSVDTAIRELYIQYKSRRKVAKVFGVTGPGIGYQLKRMNVPIRGVGGKNDNQKGRKVHHFVGEIPLIEWCRQNDVLYSTIIWRMRCGMTIRDAIRIPVDYRFSRKK